VNAESELMIQSGCYPDLIAIRRRTLLSGIGRGIDHVSIGVQGLDGIAIC